MADPGKRRGGPTSQAGKTRSSTNAATHGLRANGLLLPGEDEGAYVAHLAGVLAAVMPVGHAEVHAATMLADLQWRQSRWMRAENAAITNDLEAKMRGSPEKARGAVLHQALTIVNALIQTLDGEIQPDAVADLVRISRGVTPFIDKAALGDTAVVLDVAIDALERADGLEDVALALGKMRSATAMVQTALVNEVQTAEGALNKLERVLAGVALPLDPDLKRLGRYRRMIDGAIESQLRVLEALQERRTARRRGPKKVSSFGRGVPAPEVRLRIVR